MAVISSVLCSTWHYIIQHVSYDILQFPQVENCLSQVCQSCVAALILFSHLPELEERRVKGGEKRGDSSISQNPKFPWSGRQDQVHHLFQPIAHRTGISPCKTDFVFLTKSLSRQEENPLVSTASRTSQMRAHTHTVFSFQFSALPLILSHCQLLLGVSPHHLSLSSTSFSHWNTFPLLSAFSSPSECKLSYISTELSNL